MVSILSANSEVLQSPTELCGPWGPHYYAPLHVLFLFEKQQESLTWSMCSTHARTSLFGFQIRA